MINVAKEYPPRLPSANSLMLILTVSTLAAPAIVDAEEPDLGARERALDLFERAEASYDEGNLDQAVDLLLEARALFPEPVLLYNLARAYEGLGRLNDALDAYTSFLEENPEASDRGAIERRIESLREQIEEREDLAVALEQREQREFAGDIEPDESAPPVETHRVIWPWVVMATGLTIAGTGGIFGILALAERSASDDASIHIDSVQAFERAEMYAIVFDVLVAVGAVISIAGLTWALVARRQARRARAAEVAFGGVR